MKWRALARRANERSILIVEAAKAAPLLAVLLVVLLPMLLYGALLSRLSDRKPVPIRKPHQATARDDVADFQRVATGNSAL